jgi:acyl-CoA thioesterase
VAALCVSVGEELLAGEQLVTTRLSLDLVRPVERRPIDVDARVLKSGRRVHLGQIDLRQNGREVALARVQRTSMAAVTLPSLEGTGVEHRAPPDLPGDFLPYDASQAPSPAAPFLRLATDLRTRAPAELFGRGTKTAWLRVFAQLAPGRPLSNAAAVAAACDYTNALGAPAVPNQAGLLFPNADLTIHLVRHPASKWVRMAPASTWLDHGIGHSCCALWDEQGPLGTSGVTLPLIDPAA